MRGGLIKDEERKEWDRCKDSGFTMRSETFGEFEKRCDTV